MNDRCEPADAGERIACLRRNAGLTQGQLAQRLGVSREVISKWEHGKGRLSPNTSMLLRLSALLGTNVETLLNGRGACTAEDKGGIHP